MKVFISWSGVRGRHVANALRGWLPYIIHAVEPWASDHDIGAGDRWSGTVSRQLEDTSFGIVCLTKESLFKPWILFESGALAKSLASGRVCPYLIDMTPAELDGPLSQFQAVVANQDGTRKLIQALHAAHPSPLLTEERLQTTFERFWPDLKKRLEDIPTTDVQVPVRSDRTVLEEVLKHVRALSRSIGVDPQPDETGQASGEYQLKIDLRGLEVQPELVKFTVDADTPFQAFLDRIYLTYLEGAVEPYTYGKTWVLADGSGRELAKSIKGEKRTLRELGISQETGLLAAVRLRR